MCTVSWIYNDHGYQLLCNRDEKRTRKPAEPPQLAMRDAVRYLAPTDGDFGGAWLAVNEFGICIALLNGAGATPAKRPSPRDPLSRGLLVLDLISVPSRVELCKRLGDADLSVFAPFTLAALEPGSPVTLIDWNGAESASRVHRHRFGMITSSSFDTESVLRQRREAYDRASKAGLRGSEDPLRAFHQDHGAAPSAYSICMHRPDAETVSFSRICVSEREIDFFYSAAAPCKLLPGETHRLSRRT